MKRFKGTLSILIPLFFLIGCADELTNILAPEAPSKPGLLVVTLTVKDADKFNNEYFPAAAETLKAASATVLFKGINPEVLHGENDKKVIVNSMGPLWDGNEVWLLTAGGVTFAAFQLVYAVMFSSLYSALMLILFALILRGVAFEFRGKVESDKWRKIWDACIFIGSAAPAVLFGVAFANIFRGIPIDQNGIYQGNLFTLLNIYGLLGGVLFLLLFLVHGSLWLSIKSEGDLQHRASSIANKLWP